MTVVTALSAPVASQDVAPTRGGDASRRAFAPVLDALRQSERSDARPSTTQSAATGTTLPPDGHDLPPRPSAAAQADPDRHAPPAPDRAKQAVPTRQPHPAPSRPKYATCDRPGDGAAAEKDEAPPIDAAAPLPAAGSIDAPPLEAIVPPGAGAASDGAAPPAPDSLASVAIDFPIGPSPTPANDKTSPDRERATEEAVAPPPVTPAQQPDIAATPSAILPALQAFGAALHRAVTAERRQGARELSSDALVAALASAPATSAAAPSPAAAIDTTQPQWLETMVSRIEQLRDAASAPGTLADTRIRLRPDALGTVDVTVRRDDDGIHAHFTAVEPATARLLADAQPRLAELAQARGLRLTQAGVDGDAPREFGQGDRRPPAPAPQPSHTPRPASSSPADDSAAGDRLA